MAYYNPYITWVVCHPLYNPTNRGEMNTAQLLKLAFLNLDPDFLGYDRLKVSHG